ncbi:MAG: hypothetical protein Q9195_000826 [Heterodermia aff. obscurata]
MLSSLLFGFSRSLTWAIAARAFAGSVNGNVGIIRTTVAELVPQKELQPRAFSVMPLVWTIGSIFGPGFGGALANPATKYPGLFGTSGFLKTYPFALPNMIASLFFLVGLAAGFLFLKETLETKKHRRDYGRVLGRSLLRLFVRKEPVKRQQDNEQTALLWDHSRSYSTSPLPDGNRKSSPGSLGNQTPPKYSEVFSKQSSINLLTYTLLALHSVAYDQLLPVFMHYPAQGSPTSGQNVRLPFKFGGGFGIDSNRIGLLFTLYGVFGMFVQFLIFPPVARSFGVLPCLKVVTIMFPIVYVATPFTTLMPTALSQQTAMFIIMIFKCFAVVFAFPCTTILLTNSAVSLRILGTLNGVSTSISALGRAVGPALGGWTFSIGVEKGYMIVPWWVLAACAVLGALPVWWLVEMDGFGGNKDNDSDTDVNDDLLSSERDELSRSKPQAIEDDASKHSATNEDQLTSPSDSSGLSKAVSHSSDRKSSPL